MYSWLSRNISSASRRVAPYTFSAMSVKCQRSRDSSDVSMRLEVNVLPSVFEDTFPISVSLFAESQGHVVHFPEGRPTVSGFSDGFLAVTGVVEVRVPILTCTADVVVVGPSRGTVDTCRITVLAVFGAIPAGNVLVVSLVHFASTG